MSYGLVAGIFVGQVPEKCINVNPFVTLRRVAALACGTENARSTLQQNPCSRLGTPLLEELQAYSYADETSAKAHPWPQKTPNRVENMKE